ncbi:MAG: ABC transporter ATP-binding protein [Candidatus Handelsmanbacteria bacterium]|nr:ABC transporter ATP-binding protein [Candidatus Handelsmanbacteria bacterium]
MNLVEPIPPETADRLRGQFHPRELLLVLLSADITPQGRYGQSWLALTDERLLVLHHDGQAVSIPLQQVQRVHSRNYVGNGVLLVELADETVELLRFSPSIYYKFSSLPQVVSAALADLGKVAADEPPPPALPAVEHCATCGRALRPGSKVCPNCIRKTETFWRLFNYVRPYRWKALGGFLLTLALTGISLVPAQFNAWLLDNVLVPDSRAPNARDLLLVAVLGLLGVYVARALIAGARVYALGWLGQRVIYDLQTEVYNYLQFLALSFYNKHSTGRIMTRVTSDTERLQEFITEGFQEMVISILTLVGIGLVLLLYDWQLALMAMIPTPLMVIGTLFYTQRIHWVFHGIWRRIASLNAHLADTIPGAKVVKAFAQERREIDRFDRRNAEVRRSRMEATKMRSFFLPGMTFITSIGSLIIWWSGGNKVLGGDLSVGELQLFISYMTMFYQPVRDLCLLSERLQSAATSAERVFEILDTPAEVADFDQPKDPGVVQGAVEFQQVSFTYDGSARILDNVSFAVTPGEMIGIVGPSGAGKSTLVNLISRFYDATDGVVLLDGSPVQDLAQQKLRAQIGVVLQEPLLFQGSIADNIAYGKPEARREEIIAVARAANAHKFIMHFPDGYDTEVGERGARLSGGERQRISIARALISDPRILILDEATSSVDTQTEYEIQEALGRLIAGRTTFAIAHRLSTLKNANRLLVLDQGRIVEVGTHEELLSRPEGLYRKLVDMQTEMARMRAV